jgi:hypothetical protein
VELDGAFGRARAGAGVGGGSGAALAVVAVEGTVFALSALLPLPLLPELVALELLLVDLNEFHVSFADVHAILAQDHFGVFSGDLDDCLAGELAVLEDEAETIGFDFVAVGLDQFLDDFVLRDLEGEPDTTKISKICR